MFSAKLQKAICWVVDILGLLGPLFLLFFLASSGYAVFYEFSYKFLFVQPSHSVLGFEGDDVPRNRPAAYAIWALLVLLKLNWVGSWAMGLFITFFCDKEYVSPTRGQSVMQAGPAYLPGTAHRWKANGRPRQCPTCDRQSADRIFHDDTTDRCLPLMDHYCIWIHVCVYSRTMKSYLYFIMFLMFDVIATMGISIWALAITWSARTDLRPFLASLLSALTILGFGVWNGGLPNWWHFAIKNEVELEYRGKLRKPVHLAFQDTRDHRHISRIQIFSGNPWDLGWKENLRQVLGESIWMWAFFWIQPERVEKYGHYLGGDLLFNERVWTMRQQVTANPLSNTEFELALLSPADARAQRMAAMSIVDNSVSSIEEATEPRRRQARTSEL
ncbi:hypothetical protein BJ166DRAFT_584976 [Pestalotiopsis sp. NC0098]|nr:hypothetical protein BJ166DRAFT_584976 [Pestalotiopsis sp. NC0098]